MKTPTYDENEAAITRLEGELAEAKAQLALIERELVKRRNASDERWAPVIRVKAYRAG